MIESLDLSNDEDFLSYARKRLRTMGYSVRRMPTDKKQSIAKYKNYGLAWKTNEEKDLVSILTSGGSLSDMVAKLERTPKSIVHRLVSMNLIYYKPAEKAFYYIDDSKAFVTYHVMKTM